MAIVVIGGQTRNIGKTSLAAGLIAALPQMQWTAFKITQFGHGICSANGKPCGCETGPHTIAISEECDPTTGTDSARFLMAGAVRSLWVRTRQGQLADAMPRVRKELAAAQNIIIESNSILEFVEPDIYLTVLDATNSDFKISWQKFLSRADAIVWSGCGFQGKSPAWPVSLLPVVDAKPQFALEPEFRVSRDLAQFVADKLEISFQPALTAHPEVAI